MTEIIDENLVVEDFTPEELLEFMEDKTRNPDKYESVEFTTEQAKEMGAVLDRGRSDERSR